MMEWALYQKYRLIEQGLRERLEKAIYRQQILFLLSAIMDTREARLNLGEDK